MSKLKNSFDHLPTSHKATTIQELLSQRIRKFPYLFEDNIYEEMSRLQTSCEEEFLARRKPRHLARMICAQYFMRKTFFRSLEDTNKRYVEVRFLPSILSFPFSSKPVLGLMVGINLHDRYELFTDEHLIRAIMQLDSSAQPVKGISYCCQETHEKIKFVYIELERPISNKLQRRLLKEEIKRSVEKTVPSVFMPQNEEDILKNILILSKEITGIKDLPQAMIHLEEQTTTHVVFRVILLLVSQSEPALFKALSQNKEGVICCINRLKTVRYFGENHALYACVFSLCIPKTSDLLRTDASLNFYLARKRVCGFLQDTIGEFRDYNGSIIFQQRENFALLRDCFKDSSLDLLENFFYSLSPLEVQATLPLEVLESLCKLVLEAFNHPLSLRTDYFFKTIRQNMRTFIVFRSMENGFHEFLFSAISESGFSRDRLIVTQFSAQDSIVLGVLTEDLEDLQHQQLTHILRSVVLRYVEKIKSLQVLRLAVLSNPFSLDPRIGGDESSKTILKLLFEGLTRIDAKGQVIPGVAEKIEVSADGKHYIFKLRKSVWSNGDTVVASDFEYAWKTLLSPHFKTPFAYLFYSIKNAQAVKEGKVSSNELGVRTIDEKTLSVELEHPIPYFLELLTLTQFSPIHSRIDHARPNWPTQTQEGYVCNGAFLLKQNHPSYGYYLVKNPSYWDVSSIQLDQIKIIKSNEISALQLFQRDELDWFGYPMGINDFSSIGSSFNKMMPLANEIISWCVFNTQSFPFHYRKLRQAFALAVDRAEIMRHLSGILWPAFTILPAAHSRSIFMEEDYEKAVRLFQEALEELKLDRQTFPPLHFICVQRMNHEKITECIARSWEKLLGVRCHITSLPWPDLMPRVLNGDFQIALCRWISLIDDPSYTLATFRDAHEPINLPKWENKEFQMFFDMGQQEQDLQRRWAYFAKAEDILIQEAPVIPILRVSHGSLRKGHLSLINHGSLKSWDFKWASINNKERYL